MSRQKEIILSGVGGQGMILCGKLIAEAAVTIDDKRATLSSEYGVETRGTFAKSDVIVSSEEIYFPDVTEPDLIICLAQVAYDRYSGAYGDDVKIIYNDEEVTANPERSFCEYGISLDQLSREIGHPAVANIVTLGIVTGVLDVISEDAAKAVVREFFEKKGEKLVALNIKAFETGMDIGRKMK